MILTKKLTIKINGMNYKHYMSKGYVVLTDDGKMRRNEELEINPFDAIHSNASGPKVLVECESCQKQFEIPIGSILHQLKTKNTCYCKNCQDSVNAKKRVKLQNPGGKKKLKAVKTDKLCDGGCGCRATHKSKAGKYWCNNIGGLLCLVAQKKAAKTFKQRGRGKGKQNGMYGKSHSIESKKHLSNVMKEKIRNGSFTPNVTNSWANSKTFLQIEGSKYYFRSSWEAIFWLKNQSFQFEKLRIPYIDEKKTKRNYLVDFIDNEEKKIYEVKPSSQKANKNNVLKFDAATKWADEHSFEFVIITEEWFKNNLTDEDVHNFSKFGEKITKGLKSLLK